MLETLQVIIAEIAEIDDHKEIQLEKKFSEDFGMDSLMMLDLVIDIENEFNIKVGEEMIVNIKSVQNLQDIIKIKIS